MRVQVTGLAQKLGQLEAVNGDLQSKYWANLKILGQPCNFNALRTPREGPTRGEVSWAREILSTWNPDMGYFWADKNQFLGGSESRGGLRDPELQGDLLDLRRPWAISHAPRPPVQPIRGTPYKKQWRETLKMTSPPTANLRRAAVVRNHQLHRR